MHEMESLHPTNRAVNQINSCKHHEYLPNFTFHVYIPTTVTMFLYSTSYKLRGHDFHRLGRRRHGYYNPAFSFSLLWN